MVLLEEITGTVPAGTPVIMECSTNAPSTNRLNVGGTAPQISDNKLNGVYFNCSLGGHINRIEYDKATMRVLGICSDGSLGFITDESLDYIPANSCYIRVDKGSPDEYKFVSAAEFQAGVEDLIFDGSEASDSLLDVYNLHGQLVLRQATRDQLNTLPSGIYIAGGKKYVIR